MWGCFQTDEGKNKIERKLIIDNDRKIKTKGRTKWKETNNNTAWSDVIGQ